ncbi:hypothetical protein M5E87_04400 [Flavonifractor plautii]|nr:hypothetical protein M5E87_04400 [Flavonifractor plautii]
MKKSRVLALGLTAALSVSLLVSCGTGDTQTTPAPEGALPWRPAPPVLRTS